MRWIAYIVVASLIALLLGSRDLPKYWDLCRHGALTEGKVISVDKPNHCAFRYRYTVDKTQYEANGTNCNARVGDNVSVTYLPASPMTCQPTGHMQRLVISECLFVAAAALLMPLFVYLSFKRKIAQLSQRPHIGFPKNKKQSERDYVSKH